MHHLFHNEGGWVNPETRDDSARNICRAVVVFGRLPPRPGGVFPRLSKTAIAVCEWLVAHIAEPGGDERLPVQPCLVRHAAARVGGRIAVLPAHTKQPEGEKELVARVLQAAAGQ